MNPRVRERKTLKNCDLREGLRAEHCILMRDSDSYSSHVIIYIRKPVSGNVKLSFKSSANLHHEIIRLYRKLFSSSTVINNAFSYPVAFRYMLDISKCLYLSILSDVLNYEKC